MELEKKLDARILQRLSSRWPGANLVMLGRICKNGCWWVGNINIQCLQTRSKYLVWILLTGGSNYT
jgi:hypothetical protein